MTDSDLVCQDCAVISLESDAASAASNSLVRPANPLRTPENPRVGYLRIPCAVTEWMQAFMDYAVELEGDEISGGDS